MSIEQSIDKLTAAIEHNTEVQLQILAAMQSGGSVAKVASDKPAATVKVEKVDPKKTPEKPTEKAAPAVSGKENAEASATSTAESGTGSGAGEATDTGEFKYETLQAAVHELVVKDRNAAIAILTKHGVKNALTLPKEQWEPVYKEFRAAIDGGSDELA